MVLDAITAVTRNMTRASVITGAGRLDRLEYPIEVVRELIVNAVMHRDYSPSARGAQVQVELYPDRLVVRSPGGFFGAVDPTNFGEPDVSSSRNALLSRLLAVQVTVPHHALLTEEVLNWIQGLAQDDLTQAQVQTLALLRAGGAVRNQTLRGWGLHPTDATRELSDLVRRGLAVKIGDRRGASYKLSPTAESTATQVSRTAAPRVTTRQRQILRLARDRGEITSQEVVTELGSVSYGTVIAEINRLIDAGLLRPTAPARSRKRTYVPASE